jgi:hypothetical protein
VILWHKGIATGIFFQRRNKTHKKQDETDAQAKAEAGVGGACPEKAPGFGVPVDSYIQEKNPFLAQVLGFCDPNDIIIQLVGNNTFVPSC